MSFTNIYDDTFPSDTELANLIGSNLRQVRLDVQQRMAAISGLSTSMPAFASDAQPSNWTGILFFATDNGHIYQFNGSTWTDVTSTILNYRTMGWFSVSGPTVIASGQTVYVPALGASQPFISETSVQIPMPIAGTFRAMYLNMTTSQPSSGSLIVTLRIGGVSQGLAVTVAASSVAGVYSNVANASFSAGNLVDTQIVNNATANSGTVNAITLVY